MRRKATSHLLAFIALLWSLGTACAATVSAPGSAAPGETSLAALLRQAAVLPLNAWAGLPMPDQRLMNPPEPALPAPTEPEPELYSESAMLTPVDAEQEPLGVSIFLVLTAGAALRFLLSPSCRHLMAEVYFPRNY